MKSPELLALDRLARRQGVQLSYVNGAGRREAASPETLMALLRVLGSPIERPVQAPALLRAAQDPSRRPLLSPVTVAWEGQSTLVPLALPVGTGARRVAVELHLEDGSIKSLRVAGSPGAKGRSGAQAHIRLPKLPLGYHHLLLDTPAGLADALVISAPVRSYARPGPGKQWGLFLPMHATHSNRSWGAGDFGDWARLSRWTATLGANVLATLPLLAAFLDQPTCEPSPYAPASRLFWNEFYLDMERLPEFSNSAAAQKLVSSTQFQRRLAEFRREPTVDYAEQMRARREVLEILAANVWEKPSPRRQALERFLKEHPELNRYAQFRATCDQAKASWPTWPDRLRNGDLRKGDYREKTWRYYAYAQWAAHEQMTRLVETSRAEGVHLYLDLPLGVHPDGYDVWRERELFAHGASVGAPPDLFFSRGQNWGFAPLHPRRIREQHYRYVLEYLRFQLRHTGLLRIDHVMGLHRLYWIPQGLPPDQGAYVTYAAEELYALLSLESHRHQTTLVGENLGTVPPEVNSSMERHRLRQMFVLQFEQRLDPRRALRLPPARCVASLNTHDTPTFTAHWLAKDITDRVELGLLNARQAATEKRARKKLNAALVEFLRRQGCLKGQRPAPEAVWQACAAWLGASPAETVLLNLEDAWGEVSPQNVPGTHRERPNWRRKASRSLEEIEGDQPLTEFLRGLAQKRNG